MKQLDQILNNKFAKTQFSELERMSMIDDVQELFSQSLESLIRIERESEGDLKKIRKECLRLSVNSGIRFNVLFSYFEK